MLGAPGLDSVAQNQAEQVGAEDSQNATDDGADEALEADNPQARLEKHYAKADDCSGSGGFPALKGERPQHEACDRHNENEDRTYE